MNGPNTDDMQTNHLWSDINNPNNDAAWTTGPTHTIQTTTTTLGMRTTIECLHLKCSSRRPTRYAACPRRR